MSTKYSIIVPVYNASRYLNQCLDSIVAQTYKNYEVVLVDDGSTDDSYDICKSYEEKISCLKVLKIGNSGVTRAREVAAQNTTGDYIVCMDSDDWIDENYLESFEKAVISNNADVICCGSKWHIGDVIEEHHCNAQHGIYNKNEIKKSIFPYLIEDNACRYFAAHLWAKAFKADLYKKWQFKGKNVTMGEDNATVKACMYNANTIAIIENCSYNYRIQKESLTNKKRAFEWNGPKDIGMHLDFSTNNDKNMKEQIYRCVTHYLFNVASSQFNLDKPYKQISKDIKINIKDSYYLEAINNCSFRLASKGMLAKFALKYRCIFFMYLYQKARRRG